MTNLPMDIVRASDYLAHAQASLDPKIWAWLSGGAAGEETLRANRKALTRHSIYNRVLRDLSNGHTRLDLLGQEFSHPILLAPIGYQALLHPDGEIATAMAADATDTTLVLSTLSSKTMEDVATAGTGSNWLQLYAQPDWIDTANLITRAEAAGYSTLVVTVDTPVQALVPAAQRQGFSMPPSVKPVHLSNFATHQREIAPEDSLVFQAAMTEAPKWTDLQKIIHSTSLPVLVKGISHPNDAARCLELGAQGLIVSNHGGRALDGMPGALDLLSPLRKSVGPDVCLLFDGGIESGADIFRALALGADAISIGKLQGAALAVGGALGVAHMLKLLREEFELIMALAGCACLEEITTNCLFDNPGVPN